MQSQIAQQGIYLRGSVTLPCCEYFSQTNNRKEASSYFFPKPIKEWNFPSRAFSVQILGCSFEPFYDMDMSKWVPQPE